MKYILRYARTVILTTVIEADSEEEALRKGSEMEGQVKLGLRNFPDSVGWPDAWVPAEGSTIESVTDDDTIWEVQPSETDPFSSDEDEGSEE